MRKEELQAKINQADHTAEDMRRIAESYLRGGVLRDVIAAEAWLSRAIACEDGKESMIAMVLLAKEILGKERAVSEEDRTEIEKAFAESDGEEREKYLYIMRELDSFYRKNETE